MNWSFRRCLGSAGAPAAVFLVAWSIRGLSRRAPDESPLEAVWPIVVIIALVWLAAAGICWLTGRAVQFVRRS
jgi:beta-lactamase regulating signal transducer with metallopeptidase domain